MRNITQAIRLLAAAAAIALPLAAQQPVAPTPEPVGRSRGQDAGGYNIVNSFEVGYRSHRVDGNPGKYRSDVNYGNGVRLLGSQFTMHSKDGHGRFIDELVATTQGLGGDPYQFVSARIQKNRLWRYDFVWRLNEYYNPALPLSFGQHWLDTRRQWQDHDVTLLPQSPVKILAGFSRVTQRGPGLTTGQYFDARGDEFAFLSDIDRRQNEYRLGAETRLAGFRFFLLHGWQNFREETPLRLPGASAGNNPSDATTLGSLSRTEPYSGNSPFWRFRLYTEQKRWFAVNSQFAYSAGRRSFVLDETASGTDRLGAARDRQVLVQGHGRRPLSTGTLTLSLFPTSRLTLTNHTAFHQVRMEGDAVFLEVNNATRGQQQLRFHELDIRSVVNLTDATYQAARWIGFYGGYHHSTRRIRSLEAFRIATTAEDEAAEQDNRLQTGLAGVRLRPAKGFTVNLDGELGRADQPFYPISERNYHALGGRAQYKAGALLISASAKTNYNTNSVSLFTHSARARTYTADASWAFSRRLSVDAGYAKLHLDWLTGIAYFARSVLVGEDNSIYVSNIHTGNLAVRWSPAPRVDLYGGFSRVQDAGDGRGRVDQPLVRRPAGSTLPAFRAAQTFPLTYQSPLGRLSIRIHEKIRWNVGYQFYHYLEDFSTAQNYRAPTGYTSLSWSF